MRTTRRLSRARAAPRHRPPPPPVRRRRPTVRASRRSTSSTAPGRRTGQIAPSDIIVTGSKTLPDRVVTAIRRLPGVTDVEQISLGQAVIENRALNVAAVDPATYRNYTPAGSAQADEVWNRVAGGELAIRRSTAKKLPVGADGFLGLGSAEDAPPVHIGAYAAQALEVDAVVNDTWIPDLDLTPGNALLIRVGRHGADHAAQADLAAAARHRLLGPDDRRDRPLRTRPRRRPDGRRGRLRRGRGRHLSLHGAGWRSDRAGARVGRPSTSPPRPCRSWAASPATRRSSRS